MNTKLWILASPWWLGCGGIVDMGTVVDPAAGGTGGTATGSAGAAGSGGGSAGSSQGPGESFEHELLKFVAWGGGMCGLFSDERVRCWTYTDAVAREVPDLRGVAGASDPFDPAGNQRVCVVEQSGRVACRDHDCFDKPEACWFPGETTQIVGVESAVSIWMGGCQGLALRADGFLQQWMDSRIPCGGATVPGAPRVPTVVDFQVFGAPEGYGEPITAIPSSGAFGFVTDSGHVSHTRRQPSLPSRVPSEMFAYDDMAWPPFGVAGIDDAVAVASSYQATAILRRSGKIWAFGNQRALGTGSAEEGIGTGEVLGIDDAVAIAAGSGTCAIRSDQSLWCWGPSLYGELGFAGPEDEYGTHPLTLYSPVKVPDIEGVRAVSMTPALTCIVRGANEVSCWGFPTASAVPHRIWFR
jgi:hypothetical protein